MIVFPMAGLSSRFKKAGYTQPKYMLPLGGGSMLQAVVQGFASQFDTQSFMFICRDVAGTVAFIQSELATMPHGPADVRTVELERETSGQAETVYLGLKHAKVSGDTPITIFNIDSQHQGFRYPEEFDVSAVDGYLEVFRAEGDHWSFVEPEPDASKPNTVARVTEKLRISDLCSTGLYHFKEAALFIELYEESLSSSPEDLQGGERYVAPLYNGALQRGLDIRYAEVSSDAIAFTGTPEEYMERLRILGT